MIALVDGDMQEVVGNYWIGRNGYARHRDDRLVHRSIVAWVLGRDLKRTEHVHHINGHKLDNRRENLLVCSNQYHQMLHRLLRVVAQGYSVVTHSWCSYHHCAHPKQAFSTRKGTFNGLHNMCREATNRYRKHHGLNCNKFDWKARLNQQYRRVKTCYTEREICWLPKEGKCPCLS